MFDMFTRQELSDLHTSLCEQHDEIHQQLVGPDGKPRFSVFSAAWAVLRAKSDEIHETAEAVYAEIKHRDEERSGLPKWPVEGIPNGGA